MDNKNLRSQKEVNKTSTAKIMWIYFCITFALCAFSGYMYWSFHDTKKTIASLKKQKSNLVDAQEGACTALKRELDSLVQKDLFQESYKIQQENTKEGIFMYSINESNTKNRQEEIRSSLDNVCTKNNKQIEEIEKELKRILVSFS